MAGWIGSLDPAATIAIAGLGTFDVLVCAVIARGIWRGRPPR
jgi:hypothetical protein